MSIISGIFTN